MDQEHNGGSANAKNAPRQRFGRFGRRADDEKVEDNAGRGMLLPM